MRLHSRNLTDWSQKYTKVFNCVEKYSEDQYIQLSNIQHFVFCRRQWALIAIEQVWVENYLTFDGRSLHENAHEGLQLETRGDLLITRGLPVRSTQLGLVGQCDIVEFHRSQEIDAIRIPGRTGTYRVIPVEYKRGRVKIGLEDEMQVAAQALALEEMLSATIPIAYLYYGAQRRRHEVKIDSKLRDQVTQMADEMHEYFDRAYVPKVRYQKKCDACSLKDYCQPKLNRETNVMTYIRGFMNEETT